MKKLVNTLPAIYKYSDIVDYLRALGVEEAEIARLKYKALKEYAVTFLKFVAGEIERGNFDAIPVAESPAGDDMGEYNCYIDFDGMDIGDILEELEELASTWGYK